MQNGVGTSKRSGRAPLCENYCIEMLRWSEYSCKCIFCFYIYYHVFPVTSIVLLDFQYNKSNLLLFAILTNWDTKCIQQCIFAKIQKSDRSLPNICKSHTQSCGIKEMGTLHCSPELLWWCYGILEQLLWHWGVGTSGWMLTSVRGPSLRIVLTTDGIGALEWVKSDKVDCCCCGPCVAHGYRKSSWRS